MKKILFVILILVSINSFAQLKNKRLMNLPTYDNKWLHFGFTLGFNTMDFMIIHSDLYDEHQGSGDNKQFILDEIYAIENMRNPGLHLGPVTNMRVTKFMDLRLLVQLSFGQRNLRYRVAEYSDDNEFERFVTHEMKLETIFIEAPLLLKIKSKRVGNYRPYLIGGINPKLDLAAKKKVKPEEMPKIRLSNKDLYYELGFGIDYYMPYFKFATEIKFAMGLSNILKPDGTEYSTSIKTMFSKMWVISFHFEG